MKLLYSIQKNKLSYDYCETQTEKKVEDNGRNLDPPSLRHQPFIEGGVVVRSRRIRVQKIMDSTVSDMGHFFRDPIRAEHNLTRPDPS